MQPTRECIDRRYSDERAEAPGQAYGHAKGDPFSQTN